ncbi:MAG: FecR family protein [Nitrospirota bacterium]
MMKRIYLPVILILLFPGIGLAEEIAGSIVALKGKALILRDAQTREAVLRESIVIRDTVETKQSSRVKMLFVDDSLLTLSENSRLIVKEYIASSAQRKGRSVFNLINGKLRSLVGGGEFEIHTPTMTAAARGTYFITWVDIEDGITVSGVTVLEGVVEVHHINPAIAGVVRLERGTMTKVSENKPPAPAMTTPPQLLKELIRATELQETPEVERRPPPVRETAPVLQQLPPPILDKKLPVTPPIENQVPLKTTPVRIRIPIPEGI